MPTWQKKIGHACPGNTDPRVLGGESLDVCIGGMHSKPNSAEFLFLIFKFKGQIVLAAIISKQRSRWCGGRVRSAECADLASSPYYSAVFSTHKKKQKLNTILCLNFSENRKFNLNKTT